MVNNGDGRSADQHTGEDELYAVKKSGKNMDHKDVPVKRTSVSVINKTAAEMKQEEKRTLLCDVF